LVAPAGDRPEELRGIIWKKRHWIMRKKAELEARTSAVENLVDLRPSDGGSVHYRGERFSLRIEDSEEGPVQFIQNEDIRVRRPVGTSDDEMLEALESWLKGRLLEELAPLVEKYSALLGVRPAGIRVRKMKTRWGSCGSTGRLTFNLRLVHLHPDATEYVVAHEMCHLRHRDHSCRFRELLDSVLPARIPRTKRVEDLVPGR